MRFFGRYLPIQVYQFNLNEFIHAASVATVVPSKHNDIKQTFANIRLAQLAYQSMIIMQAYGLRSAQHSYASLRSSVNALELKPTKQPIIVGSHKKKCHSEMKCFKTRQKTRKEGSFQTS